MNNKKIDKVDEIINEALQTLMNMLKEHMDDDLCHYVYLELLLEGIVEDFFDFLKEELFTVDGAFKVKKTESKNGKNERYSMHDLIDKFILYISVSLLFPVLSNKADEIEDKYGYNIFMYGVMYYLRNVFWGVKESNFNDSKKMIQEYILGA